MWPDESPVSSGVPGFRRPGLLVGHAGQTGAVGAGGPRTASEPSLCPAGTPDLLGFLCMFFMPSPRVAQSDGEATCVHMQCIRL